MSDINKWLTATIHLLIIRGFLLSMLLFMSSRNNCSVCVQIFQKTKVIVIDIKILKFTIIITITQNKKV